MNTLFVKAFEKEVSKIRNGKILKSVEEAVESVENASDIHEIPNLKKMKGSDKTAYRIRIGDYRIGFHLVEGVAIFNKIGHRKDFYRDFP